MARAGAAALHMRIVFLTGIWPPDVGGPATHGPDFARFLVGRGPRGPGRDNGRRRAGRAPVSGCDGRRAAPVPVRYGQVAELERARPGRPTSSTPATYAAAAAAAVRLAAATRRQARLRPGVRARAPLRPLHGHARGVPGRGGRDYGAEAARGRERSRRRGRSSCRASTSPRSRAAGRSTRAPIRVLTNPAPPPARSSAEQPSADLRLRRPADRQKALDVAIDASPRAGGESCRRRRRPRARRARAAAPAMRADGRVRFLGLPRDEVLRARRGERGGALERLGEPAALGGRGAVGRHAGGLDGRRRRARGRSRRRERPARAARAPEALAAAMRRIVDDAGLRDRLAAARATRCASCADASTARLERCCWRRRR